MKCWEGTKWHTNNLDVCAHGTNKDLADGSLVSLNVPDAPSRNWQLCSSCSFTCILKAVLPIRHNPNNNKTDFSCLFTYILSLSACLSLDGGSDGPHGGPWWHPACQPLQGEDLHVWRGVWLLSQPGQSRGKVCIKEKNWWNSAFVFLKCAPKPSEFNFVFLCRRRCTGLQPGAWSRVSYQATMPPCLPTDPQVCQRLIINIWISKQTSCVLLRANLWICFLCGCFQVVGRPTPCWEQTRSRASTSERWMTCSAPSRRPAMTCCTACPCPIWRSEFLPHLASLEMCSLHKLTETSH